MSETITKSNNVIIQNNQAVIRGKILSDFRYSHEVFGERFYMIDIAIERMSGYVDTIPVMVSEKTVDVEQQYIGKLVHIDGYLRSYNKRDGEKTRLILSVYVKEMEFIDEILPEVNNNDIFLEGFVCRNPVYRTTPMGRKITDLLIGVNRPYGKSDYLPCIFWGDNAVYTATFQVGDKIRVSGRFQSREYVKKINETESETKIAYEVSARKVERLVKAGE